MRYAERVEAGVCVQCAAPAALNSDRCAPHRDQQRERDREWRKARRQANRREKRCADCGEPSKTYRCTTCAIKAGFTKPASVNNNIDKRARIDLRTNTDPSGRKRYHGKQRTRGHAIAERDAMDLVEAKRLLTLCEQGLTMARTTPDLSTMQRRAAVHAAVAHADRVARMISELCARAGYAQQRLVMDGDD